MHAIVIGSGGSMEVLCVKCLVNQMRAEGRRDPGMQLFDFVTPHGTYTWDVEKAISLVGGQDGLAERMRSGRFVDFDAGQLRDYLDHLQEDAVDYVHVNHVDASWPGVIAQAWDCRKGRPAAVLIDGNHRAARCYVDGRPFKAVILSWEESERCIVQRPDLPPEVIGRLAAEEAFPAVEGV